MFECAERKEGVENGAFSQPAEDIRRVGKQGVTNHCGVMTKEWEESPKMVAVVRWSVW
jgi:hypothetical protein